METLPLSQIPEHLKQGELYRSLLENIDDPDEEVTFPVRVLKRNTTVQGSSDCDHLLDSARFWGVSNVVTRELIDFVLSNPSSMNIEILKKYPEFASVQSLCQIAQTRPLHAIKFSHKSGSIESVHCFSQDNTNVKNSCDLAAEGGSVDVMKYLQERGCKWSAYTGSAAAQHGNLAMLQYLSKHGYAFKKLDLYSAAVTGNLECLQYLYSIKPEKLASKWILDTIVSRGHAQILTFLISLPRTIVWNSSTTALAAQKGHLDCLKVLLEHGCPWDTKQCAKAAAENGYVECLQFAHEHGCPWDESVPVLAALHGHLNCLKYAHENGCPWTIEVCTNAAKSGNLECIQFIHEHRCPWDKSVTVIAAQRGDVNMLQYAHEYGGEWSARICSESAQRDHWACLQHAHEHGCPWDENTCTAAAEGGHLGCLQYAHEHACPWDENTCSAAAEGGHLACLQYAHEHGCPWDMRTGQYALWRQHVSCLEYAYLHDCPLSTSCTDYFRKSTEHVDVDPFTAFCSSIITFFAWFD